MKYGFWGGSIILICGVFLVASTAGGQQQQPLVIKALAERKMSQLPDGPLFWRIQNFSTLAEAQAAAGPWGLAVEAGGKVWLFKLGPKDEAAGGGEVIEVGPLPRVAASEYLLRINEATGPTGSVTAVHTHPGSEAFFVLTGEQCIRTSHGVIRVQAGQPANGHEANTPMQVSSCGSTDLHALVMFLVDATKPFSSPATFP
ncbi:MAG TPA: cupin domain-containing protein [Meiothermus sp.]|nr:cupin domain-containing protein [Meiothermus sp.]